MTHPNASTAQARVLVDELIRNGIRRFVVSPGSRSAALVLAMADRPDAVLTVSIDERSAGFHALGMGKAGKPSAVVVTSGTAAANLFPAVVEAEMSGCPLLVLTADRPPELRDVGANQTIDQIGLYGSHVRWFCEVGVAEDHPGANGHWRSTVCRAVAEATGVLSGPVHLNLAFREPVVPRSDDGRTTAPEFMSATDGRTGGAPWTTSAPGGLAPVTLPSDLTARERGVVVVGAGWYGTAAADRLAATLGWPLIAEPTSGGRPGQSITTAHLLAAHDGFARTHRPDIALVLGRVGLSRSVGALLEHADVVVADAGRWSDPTRRAVLRVSGPIDPGPVTGRVGTWRRSWFEAERTARTALDEALDRFAAMSELRIARDTSLAAGPTLVVASSMPVRDLDMVMLAGSTEVVSNRGVSGIDGFVSTTLGVAAAHGSVVALAGDLSMLHDHNGMLAEPLPDAVFVVIDNDGGGIFSFLPQSGFPTHFERLFGTPHGRSFERYAAFHRVGFRRVETPGELIPAIEGAKAAGGVQLVVASTDRRRTVGQHREVTAAVHAALDEL